MRGGFFRSSPRTEKSRGESRSAQGIGRGGIESRQESESGSHDPGLASIAHQMHRSGSSPLDGTESGYLPSAQPLAQYSAAHRYGHAQDFLIDPVLLGLLVSKSSTCLPGAPACRCVGNRPLRAGTHLCLLWSLELLHSSDLARLDLLTGRTCRTCWNRTGCRGLHDLPGLACECCWAGLAAVRTLYGNAIRNIQLAGGTRDCCRPLLLGDRFGLLNSRRPLRALNCQTRRTLDFRTLGSDRCRAAH